MSNRPTVVITRSYFFKEAKDLLSERCNLIICEEVSPTREAILRLVENADAILWCSKHKLDQQVVEKAGSKLRVVSMDSAGYDQIDVDVLKSRGIKFGNTSKALSDCVSEVAIALTLTAAHRIQEGYNRIIKGEWPSLNITWLLGQQLYDSVVGIIGLGRIGTEIGRRMKAFKVKQLLYTGHTVKSEGKELGAIFVPFDDLLRRSDFIIVSCPLNDSTKNLFGKKQFDEMKSNAIIINISRGAVINQDDLVDALQNKTIGGAALDVMTPEPLPPDHPLTKLDNCVLSPHIASATHRTVNAMQVLAAQNILAALEGKPMPSPVF